jgi:hypothetical protein
VSPRVSASIQDKKILFHKLIRTEGSAKTWVHVDNSDGYQRHCSNQGSSARIIDFPKPQTLFVRFYEALNHRYTLTLSRRYVFGPTVPEGCGCEIRSSSLSAMSMAIVQQLLSISDRKTTPNINTNTNTCRTYSTR